ncbi:MAG: MnhB domain-containing protein [Candidatus Aenigmarchaeota archaeon]|nr:MnhB domain-containing protein [Candidatus Aenigmarchaeota archaeon]MCK5063291.1 MnhB domain-containing protein [Candidatus Aenigmarchaeota archaeon]MCK5234586.1 MnhB domain-containing protein [Candidatus Aenigmarchaeota archaeon]MCK5289336.1 MnhB domain-containing protein [Candidatus Aenigmarchaeota archaeon]MCK5372912.1 MnhB domain-containing protein [Candidatus Aenigmarchaeota archaeon]
MDTIIKETTKIVFPFILIYGLYIALHGHITPGGGFAAGAIIGSAFVLLVISFEERDVEHKLTIHKLIDIKSVSGLLMLLVLSKLGYNFRDALIESQTIFELWSGGFTIMMNIVGMLMVATAIIVIIFSLEKEAWK